MPAAASRRYARSIALVHRVAGKPKPGFELRAAPLKNDGTRAFLVCVTQVSISDSRLRDQAVRRRPTGSPAGLPEQLRQLLLRIRREPQRELAAHVDDRPPHASAILREPGDELLRR